MTKWQGRSLKKPSGGRKWPSRGKRKYELGRESVGTRIGEKRKAEISVRGKGKKTKLLSINSANVTNPETGESAEAEIYSVLENPADPHLARRNIITKGAMIETEVGKARVTGRPGQEEALNAVLLEGNLEEKSRKEKEEISEEASKEKPEKKQEKTEEPETEPDEEEKTEASEDGESS